MQAEIPHVPTPPAAAWRRWLPSTHVGFVWLVIALLHVVLMKDTSRWSRSDVLVWDAGGYYLYLPAAFITKDVGDGSFLTYVRKQYRPDLDPDYSLVHLPNGRAVFKYPIGMAVAYSPWFALAHGYAKVAGFPPDGYSKPYQRYIALGCMVYSLLGLWLLGRELRHYVPDHLAALALLAIGLGTNLFIYSTVDAPMSHGTLFLLNVLLLRYTRQWYEAAGGWAAGSKLALVFGLMLLVRPSELWMIAVPLLWGLTSRAAVAQRLRFWLSRWRQLLAMVAIVALVGSVQLLFWRVAGGQWLMEFYPGERFYLLKPHLLDGLFSARKGWLFWSPVLVFALLGSIWLRRIAPALVPVVVVLVPFVVYLTFSWWDWTYGGGFGCRPLISLYPLLSLCLAAFLARWWNTRAVPVAFVVGALVLLSVRQSWQYSRGVVDCCNMDWARYKEHFFDH
ncbi:hypothetical protein HNQ93_002983 [Hymenobacter luteus]|uniref:Glycosyltransferase RgtA/B/C/D-like domain-containing protein n=2 Tax=Hymenobacter TaxID=89966 RepID=A0A7W9T1Z5_9BACT|nr:MULTISPECIES: hypothetical protein [Hymenobacter]MBB4603219.1 hypothetical protein [Hymenobacter latericoloratus]MBB6060117.1 hypothetical protein [Hymenobacter luteus]